MGQRPELFEREACLTETTGCGMADILAENGERTPQGKSLEGKDNLHISRISDILDKLQVATEQGLLKKVVRTHVCNERLNVR